MENNLQGEFILDDLPKEEGAINEKKSSPTSQKFKEHNSPHFYSAFVQNPLGVSFAEQEEGEEVVLLLRKHFVTNLPWIVFSLILSILPFFLPILIPLFPFPSLSSMTIFLMLGLYYLFIFGFILLNFSLWYFHIGLVTNLRLVDVDLSGILYRNIATTRHENVEEVTYKQVGFISSLFNYGAVFIQTAGAEENIEFEKVPRPSKVADVIGDLAKPV